MAQRHQRAKIPCRHEFPLIKPTSSRTLALFMPKSQKTKNPFCVYLSLYYALGPLTTNSIFWRRSLLLPAKKPPMDLCKNIGFSILTSASTAVRCQNSEPRWPATGAGATREEKSADDESLGGCIRFHADHMLLPYNTHSRRVLTPLLGKLQIVNGARR